MDSDTRILDGAFIQTSDNSVDYCLDRCYTLQFSYAGMENSDQDVRFQSRPLLDAPLLTMHPSLLSDAGAAMRL